MKVYHYHEINGEHVDTTDARIDPIEGSPLIPRNATAIAPPPVATGHVAVFDSETEQWHETVDNRGVEYWIDHETHEIIEDVPENVGRELPEGASLTRPDKTQAEKDADRIIEIHKRLKEIDRKSVRAIRSKSLRRGAQKDDDNLTALENEAENLRAELAALSQ